MRTTEHRTHSGALEVRSLGDGLLLEGVAAPFDQPTEIHDAGGSFVESIAPGAFAKTIRERADKIKVFVGHDTRSLPVGRAVRLTEERTGLYAALQLSDTQTGREVATLARDGVVTGLSIGFEAMRDEWSNRRSERRLLEVRLLEISVVTWPAYANAQVDSVRSSFSSLAVARRRLDLHRRFS